MAWKIWWLGGRREPDHLGVAAALEVEDPVVGPAVLVVAHETAMRVGRQGCLAGPREAEVEGDVALAPDVGRTMQGQDATRRQQVVHGREQRLLDLPGVHGADDQDEAATERDPHEDGGTCAVDIGIGVRRPTVDDSEAGGEVLEIDGVGPQEQRVGEKRMPGGVGHHPYGQPMFPVGADEAVEHEQVAAAQIRGRLRQEVVEQLPGASLVRIAPRHIGRCRVVDDEAVGGRTTRARARLDHERAVGGEDALAASERPRGELGGRQVAVQLAGHHAELGELRPDVVRAVHALPRTRASSAMRTYMPYSI